MSWVSGALAMPGDAGADRAGGTRLQMPNVQHPLQTGGEGWCFVADATLTYLGVPYTIPAGVLAQCDEGGTTLQFPGHYHVVYVLAAATTVLRACWQEHWAFAYAAADCIGLAYVTDHYSLYLPLGAAAANVHRALNSDDTTRALSLWVAPGTTRALNSDDNAHALSLWFGVGTTRALNSDGNGAALSLWQGGTSGRTLNSNGTARVLSMWQ